MVHHSPPGRAMHELSVAHDLLQMVHEHVVAGPPVRVVAVHVRIGVLSGIVPAALASAFRASVADTEMHDARLEVETVELVVWCPQCQAERPVAASGALRCPQCGSRMPRILRGQELELARIEVADAAENR
jgi:hydrogenase nickel incorporation protein HypA/HybF